MTYGACFGDVVGAPSEFSGAPRDVATMELARSDYDCTDDSILTCTVAKALTDWDGRDDDAFVELLSRRFVVDVHDYPGVSWGTRFVEWALAGGRGSYGSFGNGSAMRVSPVAWWASDESGVLRLARLTALPTHSHPEGIRGAQAVALAVFMARMGSSKQKIRAALEARFDGDDGAFPYDLSRSVDDIVASGYGINETCQHSVPEALCAFFDDSSVDYESTLRSTLRLGGDADTQCAMTGAIAEAMFGMPEGYEQNERERLRRVGLLDRLEAFEKACPAYRDRRRT
ncbi:ADP-ribosylglycohydrolase family protein [uncultured Bifidobacterium sp.]|uniref:ADP-ribosylglycohydrolase family protein n=1 Tax=uncultured Bifidobacterium sp. TaxID=165187 RepID=UPI0028DB401C|nr:ADP-ribosylglycohydrolase family protein [uncultured Bifidobacterium sp.]